MRKILLSMVCFSLLVFAFSGVSYGWQGRMGGMGDPYGLLEDESDFLIHPAKLAKGEGITFYGHYRFTYTDVMDWDYNLFRFNAAGVLTNYYLFESSGQEHKNNGLLGAATPLGPGRFGIFFTYDGMRGDYDGSEIERTGQRYDNYNFDLTSDLDNFTLRLLYGLPVGAIDVGVELGAAYQDEMQETWLNEITMLFGTQNFPWSWDSPERSLFPYMIPYDSNYWELLWKAGMEVKLVPLIIEFNVRGGHIVCSDNNYDFTWQWPVGTVTEHGDMSGNIAGWRIGSDIWVRVAGGGGLTFPFLFSFDYAEKDRDGDAIGTGLLDAGSFYDYEHSERVFDLKAGGGFEKAWGTVLVAAGLYYNYLQGRDDVSIANVGFTNIEADCSEFPSHREHMVIVKLAGEKEFTPVVTVRMGLDFFYGWVQEDFDDSTYFGGVLAYNDNISLDGYHWGIGGSLGGSVSFNSFTMEPFFNVGWQQFDLGGDGLRTTGNIWDMDLSRNEWYIGGGCSFLYDMP